MSDEKDDPPGYVQENDFNQSPLFTEPNVAPPYPPTSNTYQQQPIYPQQYPPPYSPAPGTIPPTQQPYPPQYPPTTGIPPYPQYQPQYYAPQQQQQQQSMNVVLGAPTAQFVVSSRPYNYVNFNGAIVLSCFVFFFCGWMCGLIAFIIAIVGQSSASGGEYDGARQMLRASYGFSIAGIVIGVIVIIILLAVFLSPRSSSSCGALPSCSYGTYYDSSDCKKCCSPDSYSYSSCYGRGYYYLNGVKMCCY